MKKLELFIRIARWLFVIAGLILIVAPRAWWPHYYQPVPMGIIAIGYSFLIILPRFVFTKTSELMLRRFEAVLAGNLMICGLGSLGLWSSTIAEIIPYDKFVHFTFALTMMVVGTQLWSEQYRWSLKRASIAVALWVVAACVVWEYIEFFFASYFHIGYFGKLFDLDSRGDIYIGLAGMTVGLAGLYWFQNFKSPQAT